MDRQNYENLFNYLLFNQTPNQFTPQQILQLQKQSKHYIVKDGILYKFNKRKLNDYLRVIQKDELNALLFMMHNDPTSGHFATDIMFEKIRNRYYWPQMYEDIRNYVKSCDSCQRRGKAKNQTELHPITAYSPFYQIGIDIVGQCR
jgi:hypothetical protein